MSWFFLSIFSVFFASFSTILQRVLMKKEKSNPYSYAIVFHFLLAALNFVFAFVHGFQVPTLGNHLPILLLSAALWGSCTVFLFKALQLLESSEVTILSTVRVVVTVIISVFLLHELFNSQRVLGTLLILVSSFLVMNVKKGVKINIGVFFALGMAVIAGLAVVVDGVIVRSYDPISYNTIINFLIGSMLVMVYPQALRQWKSLIQPEFLKRMLPLAVFSTFQALAYLYALLIGNTSQVGPILQSQIIVTVILATFLLSEKSNLVKKFLAAILVTVGVILMR